LILPKCDLFPVFYALSSSFAWSSFVPNTACLTLRCVLCRIQHQWRYFKSQKIFLTKKNLPTNNNSVNDEWLKECWHLLLMPLCHHCFVSSLFAFHHSLSLSLTHTQFKVSAAAACCCCRYDYSMYFPHEKKRIRHCWLHFFNRSARVMAHTGRQKIKTVINYRTKKKKSASLLMKLSSSWNNKEWCDKISWEKGVGDVEILTMLQNTKIMCMVFKGKILMSLLKAYPKGDVKLGKI
jgi:hypothetical protein